MLKLMLKLVVLINITVETVLRLWISDIILLFFDWVSEAHVIVYGQLELICI